MKRVLDYDAEDARLRARSMEVTAALGADRPRGGKQHSESRLEALVLLDMARIDRERASGELRIEGRVVIWEPTR